MKQTVALMSAMMFAFLVGCESKSADISTADDRFVDADTTEIIESTEETEHTGKEVPVGDADYDAVASVIEGIDVRVLDFTTSPIAETLHGVEGKDVLINGETPENITFLSLLVDFGSEGMLIVDEMQLWGSYEKTTGEKAAYGKFLPLTDYFMWDDAEGNQWGIFTYELNAAVGSIEDVDLVFTSKSYVYEDGTKFSATVDLMGEPMTDADIASVTGDAVKIRDRWFIPREATKRCDYPEYLGNGDVNTEVLADKQIEFMPITGNMGEYFTVTDFKMKSDIPEKYLWCLIHSIGYNETNGNGVLTFLSVADLSKYSGNVNKLKNSDKATLPFVYAGVVFHDSCIDDDIYYPLTAKRLSVQPR